MNEKTLNQIRKEATGLYTGHELRATMLAQAEESYSQEIVELESQAYDANIEEAAKFASENAGQLHDLAVIEAHLGGVAIKVEQPLSIGETVDVHRS